MKVAVCQHVVKLDEQENYEDIVELIETAASQDASLIVLPEFAIPAGPENHKYLQLFIDIAKRLSVDLVPGTLSLLEDGEVYNVAYYISHTGEILHSYKKRNLWHPERPHFTKGSEHVVFESRFGRTGVLVCWDLAFPEAMRSLLQQGVEVVVVPTCWSLADAGVGVKYNPSSERDFLNALCVTRAFENEVCIVFCNTGSNGDGKGGCGLSQICAPFYGRIAGFEDARRGVIVADVDMQCLKDAESVYKVRADLASDDWHYTPQHQSHLT